MSRFQVFEFMAISIIGESKYKEIFKKHNLSTKKWTRGRIKPFIREINEEVKNVLEEKKKGKKK